MKNYHTYLHESSTEREFQIEDKVKLSKSLLDKENKDFDDDFAIKKSGISEYGIIFHITTDCEYPIDVKWENGNFISHKRKELDFYDDRDNIKRKKIKRPDIDPFDEEDWRYEEINEGTWNLPPKKSNIKTFTIYEKLIEFENDHNKLINFLKEEVTDNMVEFGENSIIRKLIKGVKLSFNNEKMGQDKKEILFIDNKNKRYVVDKDYPITIYRNGETGDQSDDEDPTLDDDIKYLWIIGVPSGEAIRASREIVLNDLFNKKLIYFVKDYSPTFFGFDDEDRKKIKETIGIHNFLNNNKFYENNNIDPFDEEDCGYVQ